MQNNNPYFSLFVILMAELCARLDSKTEEKWQKYWEENKFSEFDVKDNSKPVYSIDTPPPFTSGDLHMGHVLSYAYFDFVARYKRMNGFNVYYPQGWDCQGFPTETKVEKKFGRKPPEEFRKLCIEWTENSILNMRAQMKKMGFSADWKYEYRTMDPSYHKTVQKSVVKMFHTGQIYRGEHPVFWCPHCRSALAKTDTDDVERTTQLHDLKFQLLLHGGDRMDMVVATTRPELMHACVAVLFHPTDERYNKLKAVAITPLGKEVPFMADNEVDKDFGSGVVMVCTFGDKQDVIWMYKHKLPWIKSIDEAGKLANAGEFDGLKVKEAREKILEKFKNEGKLLASNPLQQVVKVHDRCSNPIELANSWQWFAKITEKREEIIKTAKEMRWVPDFAISHLIDWANYVEWDWVISRQRVFGTPLPFWHCEKCDLNIPAEEDELPVNPPAMEKMCPKCEEIATGEKSTCDVWVDSSISPLIISKWEEDEKFFNKTYPASLRPQGVEIVRTWAFYTIYRCKELTGKACFKELLLNGNVLAPDGKKMSKSLGNIIAPDKLIEEYGADSVRIWAALSGAMAKDRPFSFQDIKYAKSFLNKFLNAGKFVQTAIEGYKPKESDEKHLREIDKYFLHRLNEVVHICNNHWQNYEFHHIVKQAHDFFWHEFCDYYLEYVKYRIYGEDEKSKKAAQYVLYNVYLNLVLLLAPIIPHSCEEVWQIFKKEENESVHAKKEGGNAHSKKENETVQLHSYPKSKKEWKFEESVSSGALLAQIVAQVRQEKANNKLALNSEVKELLLTLTKEQISEIEKIKDELCNVCKILKLNVKEGDSFSIAPTY